jgi:hypothetical protein
MITMIKISGMNDVIMLAESPPNRPLCANAGVMNIVPPKSRVKRSSRKRRAAGTKSRFCAQNRRGL